jgi:hypothetical protein
MGEVGLLKIRYSKLHKKKEEAAKFLHEKADLVPLSIKLLSFG